MSNAEPVRVLAAVIRRDDGFLLCRRPSHKRHGDCWEFPGGKLEPGESLADAAARELLEELGVRVTSVGDVAYRSVDVGSPFVIEFTLVTIAGEPEPLEHSELRWTALPEAAAMDLAPADLEFVRSVLDGATRL
jgi:8-oxo-dGTP diphosphatase